ncbi:hypothetical protein [Pontibacter burrus]|uniref:Uncharacterized protein n=1 Tax=Pontibacter burrus TaxID=2704466 RepID=A0A6B3LRP7_9BACT|nr:hypothetical protein [Pontibacter burrus]NEM98503.1 hypothetical protein [Pontibacter burrus]
MFNKIKRVDYPIFQVVADGGMSVPLIGEGRFIPSVMIDIEDNVEVAELLKLHNHTPPGDTELQWSLPYTMFGKPKSVLLNIIFLKPMKMVFGIEFLMPNRHVVVDGIIHSRAFTLQVGKRGDKVSTIFRDESKQKTHGCVLIEVPNMDFDANWNKILFDLLKHKYKKNGVPKGKTSALAKEQIKKMREIWNIRNPLD